MGLEKDDSEAHARAEAFERGLRVGGWSVRENLRIEYRFSGGDFGRMQALVTELVALKPDCLIGHTTPIVKALMRATETIPIVFVAVTDPIGSNIVASRGRPDGNTTGFAIVQATMAGKYLSILRELSHSYPASVSSTIRTNPAQRRILCSRSLTSQENTISTRS
jgi:putative ABC transport system substrate-binding protein